MCFSQIKYVSLKKTDKVGFSLINPVYLRKLILSACTGKVRLSVHADKNCFSDKPILSAQIIWVYSDKPGLSQRTPLYL